MKKLMLLALLMFSMSAGASTKTDILGTWYFVEGKDTIVYEFTKDTLSIDEVGNEGFDYIYKVEHNTIIYTDVCGYTDTFEVIDLNKRELVISYICNGKLEVVELKRTLEEDE